MWTASISNVVKDPVAEMARVTINFINDDGRSRSIIERISEPSHLKRIVSDGIREMNRRDEIRQLILAPPIGTVNLTSPPPTVADLAMRAYGNKRQELINKKQDLDLGLCMQAEYDILKAETLSLKP